MPAPTINSFRARIKDWLIQQQSGVMQSLFSHMLGELTLNQSIKVRVAVPAKPAKLEPLEIKTGPEKAEATPKTAPATK